VTKSLKLDERRVPIPHIKDLIVRDTHLCRLQEHYHNTLQDDLMYMTYLHESGPRPPPRNIRLQYDPEDPYTKNRTNLPVGGSQFGKKPAPPTTVDNVVQLEKLVLHIHYKDAIISKNNLLIPLMTLRALTGETERGGGHHAKRGVEIVRAVKSIGGWTRAGAPVGAKVTLTGPKMYAFLGTLVEFVLPRLRDFDGIVLPAGSSNMQTPAGVSGVVSFGLPPSAMAFFPQLEVNVDSYPKLPGMHITFVTNAEGQGAQNKARALVSGFQVPFTRK
jgi:large subunit ribosomal protein L5